MHLRKPSIKDIAKATGLSTAAVSYALNGKGRVSADKVELVRKVAVELGFVRDDTAARLRTGKSNLLGAIVHDISNPFFAELLSEFECAAYESGYLTIAANTQDDPERQRALLEGLMAQGVAGLMVSPVQTTDAAQFESFLRYNIPIVLSVRDISLDRLDFAGTDDCAAGYLAASHMIEAGHNAFAVIGGYDHTRTWTERLKGIRQATNKKGGWVPDSWIINAPPTRVGGEVAMASLLSQHPACQAAICFNDITAIGAYAAIHGKGLKVGSDYSIVAFDNVPQSAAVFPPLTTVELFPRRIGREAALKLIEKVDGETVAAEKFLVKPELVVRQSVVERSPVAVRSNNHSIDT